jgi:hypothetical protein
MVGIGLFLPVIPTAFAAEGLPTLKPESKLTTLA